MAMYALNSIHARKEYWYGKYVVLGLISKAPLNWNVDNDVTCDTPRLYYILYMLHVTCHFL
jgi:hypothetical protein